MIKTSRICFWAIFLALATLIAPSALASQTVAVIKTGTESYTNVTLVTHTETHVFIQHSRGVANIRIGDLDAATLTALGLSHSTGPDGSSQPTSSETTNAQEHEAGMTATRQALSASLEEMLKGMFENIKATMPPGLAAKFGMIIAATLAIILLLYLFKCYCIKLICLKAGYKPGLLAWLPILQDIALIRAAGMSALWFLVLMLPGILARVVQHSFPGWQSVVLGACGVALVVHCYWCIRICQARGKGILAMLLLIFPFTYPFAFLYLAFSGGSGRSEDGPKPIELEPLPI
jgi:hypothetical protein